jgi:hypothetical protein
METEPGRVDAGQASAAVVAMVAGAVANPVAAAAQTPTTRTTEIGSAAQGVAVDQSATAGAPAADGNTASIVNPIESIEAQDAAGSIEAATRPVVPAAGVANAAPALKTDAAKPGLRHAIENEKTNPISIASGAMPTVSVAASPRKPARPKGPILPIRSTPDPWRVR